MNEIIYAYLKIQFLDLRACKTLKMSTAPYIPHM